MLFKHLIIANKTLSIEARFIQGVMQKYLKRDKDIFSFASSVRTFLTKCTRSCDGSIQPAARFLEPTKSCQSLLVRHRNTLKLDINTNVQNNVVLYKYENERYFRNVKLFGIGQLFGWTMLAAYTYSPSFLDIFKTDVTVKEYFYKNTLKLMFFSFAIIIGPLIFATIYAFCTRSVKYIILNKGGKKVTLTTYHPRRKKSNTNISINMVKCVTHRTDLGDYLPLKLQNTWFYYVADKRGVFPNPILFDNTVGFGDFGVE